MSRNQFYYASNVQQMKTIMKQSSKGSEKRRVVNESNFKVDWISFFFSRFSQTIFVVDNLHVD